VKRVTCPALAANQNRHADLLVSKAEEAEVEGTAAIQQQQGGLVGTGPGSGSLVSRTMTSSTPTYSSSPASWTLATPSDNSLDNTNYIKCNRSFDGIHYQATITSTFAAKEQKKIK
jgi:hypothetical protein